MNLLYAILFWMNSFFGLNFEVEKFDPGSPKTMQGPDKEAPERPTAPEHPRLPPVRIDNGV